MALPIQSAPTYTCVLPSNGEEVKFRPFLVKEQKTLVIAKEGEDQKRSLDSIKSMIKSVTAYQENEWLDVEKLPMFDIEYLFIKIRAVSVGETVKINLTCQEEGCNGTGEVTVNLDEIQTTKPEGVEPKIMITDELGVILRYPDWNTMESVQKIPVNEQPIEMLKKCIVEIFDAENVYTTDDVSTKELGDFVDNLTFPQIEKLGSYFDDMPKVFYDAEYTCSTCNTQQTRTMEGLQSFF